MKTILMILLGMTTVLAQEKKKDTIYNYYDGLHKVIDLDKLGPKDQIILPIYKSKYYYDETIQKYIEIRCRLKEREILKEFTV